MGSNVPLDYLILQAYDVDDYQLIRPAWLSANRYEIEAKASDESASQSDLKKMLQALLANRFQLKLHRETRDTSVFELAVGKSGVKVQPLSAADVEKRAGRSGIGWNRDGLIANNVSFDALAQALRRESGRPILDKTGLTGKYDFTVKYDQRLSQPGGADPASAELNGSSIFTALQDQLGLRLDSRKDPVEVIVVDSAAKTPTGN